MERVLGFDRKVPEVSQGVNLHVPDFITGHRSWKFSAGTDAVEFLSCNHGDILDLLKGRAWPDIPFAGS